jgi:hypothetical protein
MHEYHNFLNEESNQWTFVSHRRDLSPKCYRDVAKGSQFLSCANSVPVGQRLLHSKSKSALHRSIFDHIDWNHQKDPQNNVKSKATIFHRLEWPADRLDHQ